MCYKSRGATENFLSPLGFSLVLRFIYFAESRAQVSSAQLYCVIYSP